MTSKPASSVSSNIARESHKVAIVGVGKIARDQHVPAILSDSDFTLAATVSRNGSIDGIDSYSDLQTMLNERPDISILSLCMPPQARFDYAMSAIAAGKHVMLEKPPGATLSEVQTLKQAAERQGVTLFATWHSRFAPAVATTRQKLAECKIKKLHISWKEDVRKWHPGQDWIWQAGGLGVFDPGINALSIMTEIMPHEIHLANATLEFPSNRDTPIAASLSFCDPMGAEIEAVFDWRQEGPQSWDILIETDAGEMQLLEGGAKLVVDGKVDLQGPDREYPSLYAKFSELLRDNVSDVDVAPLQHVADAFLLGRRIEVSPFED